MLLGIKVIGVESPDMRQQCFGEAAAFDLVVGERPLQILVQRLERGVAVDPGELAVVVNDLAVANDGANAAGLGALQQAMAGGDWLFSEAHRRAV